MVVDVAVEFGEAENRVSEGLTTAEAASRLRRDGPNELPLPPRTPAWRRLAAQMVHFFALMLWVAGVLAFVAGMPQLGVAIFVVVVLNGVFAFVQEERAEHAAERLRDLLPRRVTVVRDGEPCGDRRPRSWSSATSCCSPPATGSRPICALDRVHALAIDTSLLTGESVPVIPTSATTAVRRHVRGRGRRPGAWSMATGANTRLAAIAEPDPASSAGADARCASSSTASSRIVAVDRRRRRVGFFGVVAAASARRRRTASCSPSASRSRSSPRACCRRSRCRWRWARSGWPRATRWSAAWSRSRRSARRRSSAPTRPAR